MADTKISGFPSGGAPLGTDEILVARSGTTRKITVSSLPTGGTRTSQLYEEGVDYTGGSTTSLTLPIDAASEENILVYFDGLNQLSSEWSLTTGGSPSVDFNSAIPASVQKVEVTIFT